MAWRLPTTLSAVVGLPVAVLALVAGVLAAAGLIHPAAAIGLLVGAAAGAVGALVVGRVLVRRLTRLREAAAALGLRPRVAEPLRGPYLREVDDVGTAFDDLERRMDATIEGLRAERDRLFSVLDSMTEGVVVIDREGRIRMVNGAFLRIIGRRPDAEAVGKTLLSLVRSDALGSAARTALDGEPVLFQETELTSRPQRTVVITAAPFRAQGSDEVEGAVVVLRDVTLRRRLQTIRQDFVANVSHELKTPVAAIRGYAETLLDGALDDPEASREFVDTIHRHALRMSAMINDLLDLAALDAGAYALETGPAAPAEIVHRAVEHVAPAADARRVRVEVDVPEELPDIVADARALGQVLVNLLDNAVKYGPEGGVVRLEVRSVGPHLVFSVADQGPGIPEPARERVFERFYRVDPGRSRAMGGTGLGLSIVRHLVGLMKGTVRLESPRSGGAVFVVEIPLSPSTETRS